jgi:hypothetical protein
MHLPPRFELNLWPLSCYLHPFPKLQVKGEAILGYSYIHLRTKLTPGHANAEGCGGPLVGWIFFENGNTAFEPVIGQVISKA